MRCVLIHLACGIAGDDGATQQGDADQTEETVLQSPQLGALPVIGMFPMPGDAGAFLLSAGGAACGHLFGVTFGSDEVCTFPGMPGGVAAARFSATGRHLVLGSCDGVVRLYALAKAFTLPAAQDRYWQDQVHDMHARVCGVAILADSTLVATAASDGSAFTLTLSQDIVEVAAGEREDSEPNSSLCSVAECPEGECAEVSGGKGYTIEEAKQKVEEDALRAAADEKKLSVRETLAQYASSAAHLACYRTRVLASARRLHR